MKAGDSRAPRIAWLRFGPIVYRILRRTFGALHDVEDMRQDIFLAFFRKVPGLREPGALKAFLMAITARTIKYHLRYARVRRILYFWDWTDNMTDVEVEPADHNTRQTLAAFYGVLDTLNARDRMLFGLRFLEEMELTQVARTLGISVSTTKRHLTRVWQLVAVRVRNDPALTSDRFATY